MQTLAQTIVLAAAQQGLQQPETYGIIIHRKNTHAHGELISGPHAFFNSHAPKSTLCQPRASQTTHLSQELQEHPKGHTLRSKVGGDGREQGEGKMQTLKKDVSYWTV